MGIRQALAEFIYPRPKQKSTVTMRDPSLALMFGFDQKNKLTNAYRQLPIVYACISRKAKNIAGVPFKVTRLGSDKQLSDAYPIVQLLKRPNIYTTWEDLIQLCVTSFDTRGEWFAWPDMDFTVGGLPGALWFVPSENVKELTSNNTLYGWSVKMGNTRREFLFDDIVQGKYINLENPVRGLAPIASLDGTNKIRFSAVEYCGNFFENDGTPTVTYETDKILDPAQIAEFEKKMDLRRGRKGWHKELLLWGGIKANALSITNKDMQVLEILGMTTDEICAVLGVPKTELSIREGLNFATASIEDRAFWKKTLIPIMRFGIEAPLNRFLNRLGYNGTFDVSAIDVLNQELLEKADAATKFYNMGVPFNMINERLSLGFPEVPGGDEPKKQGGIPPLDDTNAPKEMPEPLKAVKQLVDPVEMNKALRAAEWKKQNDSIIDIERKMSGAVKKYFQDLRRKWLKHASDEIYIKIVKAKNDPPSLDELTRDLSDEKLKRYIEKYMKAALQKGIDSVNRDSVSFSMSDDKAIYALSKRLTKITRINDTIRDDLRKMFVDLMKEEKQLSELELAEVIRDSMEGILDNADSRARTIARTETHGAYADGRWESAKSTEPYGKEWIDSRDSNVRDEHAIDGEKRLWNDAFSNGLMYPGDPEGNAGNVINCRCKFRTIYDPEEMK